MRWQEEGWKGVVGWYREGPGRVAASGRFFAAENREPTEICHCWPWLFCFFVFYEVGW